MSRILAAVTTIAASGCFASYALHERAIAHNAAGIDRLAQDDLEGAASAFRLALEYNPRFSEPYNNLALVAIRNGDLDDAEDLLHHALLLNGDFAEAWTNLGGLRLRRGDAPGAVAALTEALATDPGQDDARYDLVLALLETGQIDAAWEHALRLDVASPGDPAVLALVSWTAVRLGRHAEARDWAARALAVDAAAPLAHLAMGVALMKAGRSAEADPHLRAASEAGSSPVVWLQLGLAMLDLGRWRAASDAFRRVLDEDPDCAAAHAGVGAAAAAKGEYELAERHLRAAVESGGADSAALLLLATVQAGLGRPEDAVETARLLLDDSEADGAARAAARTLIDDLRDP